MKLGEVLRQYFDDPHGPMVVELQAALESVDTTDTVEREIESVGEGSEGSERAAESKGERASEIDYIPAPPPAFPPENHDKTGQQR